MGIVAIIYNGQQVGLIASNLDKSEWFALENIGNKKRVVPGFYKSTEHAFDAFKKHRRSSRRK